MLAVIERQPPRAKLSPSERALASHVVNLAGIRPTSEVRRRQLVKAQRRSREKLRQLKLLVATKEHLAKEVETLQAQHKAHVTAYHASLALECPSSTCTYTLVKFIWVQSQSN
ncbi:unnamed protein product [Aphanomyces euteiches]|uniref:Uncharacterized protein n=1 Tax=Aphanomyces euteiches TaxID=100861 RepID=A0A6G0WRX4_9STRA|nr:hypothetical protein Ae201684_012183 [Aphanomyces euteiches]KAH9096547.1 hypothetical protein Ae201684P_013215 [Aphanomyces euteiches]KAH9150138.1 hypothetical protein AeRB84_006973 [Aphanomyces euteiches]